MSRKKSQKTEIAPEASKETKQEKISKIYNEGEIVTIDGTIKYEVIQDLGEKIAIRPIGNGIIRLIVKKERLS